MDWVGNLWMHLCSDHCLVMLIKRKSESESFSVTFNLSLNLEVVKFICFHSLVTMTEWEPTNRSLLWGTYFTKMENEGKCVACYKVLQCKGGNTVEPQIRSSASHCPSLTRNAYFTLFSREKRVKFEMLSLFPRNEKWFLFSFHSFREWKVKSKCLEIEIESEKWNENAPRSRSRSEIGKKFSRILEKRDSRRVLMSCIFFVHKTRDAKSIICVFFSRRCYFGALYIINKCDEIPAKIYLAKHLSLLVLSISQMYLIDWSLSSALSLRKVQCTIYVGRNVPWVKSITHKWAPGFSETSWSSRKQISIMAVKEKNKQLC